MSQLNITDRCFTTFLDDSERVAYNHLLPTGHIPLFEPDARELLTEYIEEVIALLGIEAVAYDYSAIGNTHNGKQIQLGPLVQNTSFYVGGAFSQTKTYTSNQTQGIIRYAYEHSGRQLELYPLLCSDQLYPLPYIYLNDSRIRPAVALPVRNVYELIIVGLLYPAYPIYVQQDFTVRSSSYPTFIKRFYSGELIRVSRFGERSLDIALGGDFKRFLPASTYTAALLADDGLDEDLQWEYGVHAVWQDGDGALNEAKIISNVQLANILTKCASRRLAVHLIIYPHDTSSNRIAFVQNTVSSFKFESKVVPRLTVLGLEGTVHPTVLTDPLTVPDGYFSLAGDDVRTEVFANFAYGLPHLCRNVTHVKTVTVLWTDQDVKSNHVRYEHFTFPSVYNKGEKSDVTVGVRATLQPPSFKFFAENASVSLQIDDLVPGMLSRSCQPFLASWEFLVRVDDTCDFLRLIRSHRLPWSKDPKQYRELWSSLGQGEHTSPLWSFISRDTFGGVVVGELQWLLSAFDPSKTKTYPPDFHLDGDYDSFDVSIMLPYLGSPSRVEYHHSGTRLPGAGVATTYEGDNDGSSEEEQLAPYCVIGSDKDPADSPKSAGDNEDDVGVSGGSDDSTTADADQSDSPPDSTDSDSSDSADPCKTSTHWGSMISLLALGAVGVYTLGLPGRSAPNHKSRNMLPLDSDSGQEFI